MRSQYFFRSNSCKIKFIRYSLIPILQHSKLILALTALKKNSGVVILIHKCQAPGRIYVTHVTSLISTISYCSYYLLWFKPAWCILEIIMFFVYQIRGNSTPHRKVWSINNRAVRYRLPRFFISTKIWVCS